MESFINALAPFAITGALASIVVQYTKSFFEQHSAWRLPYAIGISIVAGIALQFTALVPTEWYATIVNVFAAANTVYLVILKTIEAKPPAPRA